MKLIQSFVIFLFSLLFSGHSISAEIEPGGIDDAGCEKIYDFQLCLSLTISGKISDGDAEYLEEIIKDFPVKIGESLGKKARIGILYMNSTGGNLVEAMKIGRLIRRNLITTKVDSKSECHSSCVIAFLGGSLRIPVGPMGIHSFYSEEFFSSENHIEASNLYNKMSDDLEGYLREVRVSTEILDHMKRVPHFKVHILNFEEAERYGVIGIDPVYAQVTNKKLNK